MEQQTVSVAKGGMIAVLNARTRCAVHSVPVMSISQRQGGPMT